MIAWSDHCLRTVAVLIDSSASEGDVHCNTSTLTGYLLASRCAVRAPVARRAHVAMPFTASSERMRGQRLLGIRQNSRRIGKPEQFDQVQDVARALLAADHHEVILVAVKPRDEHDACLVEARRRAEHVARQRDGGREQRVEAGALALRQRR